MVTYRIKRTISKEIPPAWMIRLLLKIPREKYDRSNLKSEVENNLAKIYEIIRSSNILWKREIHSTTTFLLCKYSKGKNGLSVCLKGHPEDKLIIFNIIEEDDREAVPNAPNRKS